MFSDTDFKIIFDGTYIEEINIGKLKCEHLILRNLEEFLDSNGLINDNLVISSPESIGITSPNVIFKINSDTNPVLETSTTEDNEEQIGIFGAGPVIQGTTSNLQTLELTSNTSSIANDTATWGGYTLGQIFQNAALSGFFDLYGTADTMVMVFDTSLESGNTISINPQGTVDIVADWGDSNSDTYTTPGQKTHTYDTQGIYRVR